MNEETPSSGGQEPGEHVSHSSPSGPFGDISAAPIPGGLHILRETDDPEDPSLYQIFTDETGERPLNRLGEYVAEALSAGTRIGAGILTGTVPQGLTLRSEEHSPRMTNLIFATEDDSQLYRLTLYRRVWPGPTAEMEALKTLNGHFVPELVAALKARVQWRDYSLGLIRRIPAGPNGRDIAQMRRAAQVFSHEDGLLLGQTVRYLHDTLLMAYPYKWRPAADVRDYLVERLHRFVSQAPAIAPFEPWIRERYHALTGTMLVQRTHGNLDLEYMWFSDDDWIIGGWEGDARLPEKEHCLMHSPLEDLAHLHSSIFRICDGDPTWCIRWIRSILEGYGEPVDSLPFTIFLLDRACADLADMTDSAMPEQTAAFKFLTMFRDNCMPDPDTMKPSGFHRTS